MIKEKIHFSVSSYGTLCRIDKDRGLAERCWVNGFSSIWEHRELYLKLGEGVVDLGLVKICKNDPFSENYY